MFRAWLWVLHALSTAEAALADCVGARLGMAAHFLAFWGLPAVLIYLPGRILPILGIALASLYVALVASDIVLSVFGHEELEHRRGMLDIVSVKAMRREILAALIKYFGGVVSFATVYNGIEILYAGGAFVMGKPADVPYADLLYFSLITMATVGYGDVYPAVLPAKAAVLIEVLFGLGFAVLLFSMLVSLYIDLQRRKDTEAATRRNGRG